MSAAPKAVDVLAVLAPLADEATKKYGPDNQYFLARAAVAELIETARKLHIIAAGIQRDIDANERRALFVALTRVQGGTK